MKPDLTTVTTDSAIFHEGTNKIVVDGLAADREYDMYDQIFRTLPDLGNQLSRFSTVNDVHFGETSCGVVSSDPTMGPIFTAEEFGPYPEFMNRGAIEEMHAINPDAVLVKGDLTTEGTLEQYQQFLSFYEQAFGDKLFHAIGNHEAYGSREILPEKQVIVELKGVTIIFIALQTPTFSI